MRQLISGPTVLLKLSDLRLVSKALRDADAMPRRPRP